HRGRTPLRRPGRCPRGLWQRLALGPYNPGNDEGRTMMRFAAVFPGQGSQSIGMLGTLASAHPAVQQTFAEASEALGYDLWALAQQGPEERLNATQQTQPALLAAGVAAWRAWKAAGGRDPTAMAGHSLGEYTALVCAGAMDFKSA